jgi:hypothetical protein
MVPAPSPDHQAKIRMQIQTPQKQQTPQHVEKKRPIQHSVEKNGKPPAAKPAKPPVDYQVLLLSLADEYLNAAHSHGTTTSLGTSEADVEEYYKLVATGLGCLEAVLKVCECLDLMFRHRKLITAELALATTQRSACETSLCTYIVRGNG